MDGEKEFLTTEEAAALLNMTVPEFKNYQRTGIFPLGMLRGRRRVWPIEELPVLKWLEANQHRWGSGSEELEKPEKPVKGS